MSEAAKQESPSPEKEEVFVFPASFAQLRLWFLDRLEPGSCAYNLPMGFRVTGPLNLQALERSLDEIVRRHESLRTTFSLGEDGELQQLVHPHSPFSLARTSLESSTEAVRELEIGQFLATEATHPFDLSSGPLFRATLVRLAEEEHLLLLVAHHTIMDGWSGGILVRELGLLYQASITGKPSPLPPLKIQYGDFAAWQRKRVEGEALQNLLAFWKKQAGGAATLELPTDRPRGREQTFEGSELSRLIPKPLVDGLKRLAQQSSSTLFIVLLAAVDTLLFRYTGQEDITVGSPIAGRTRCELEGLIGFFANTIVLRTDLSGDPGFRQLLGRAREVAMDAYSHEELPLEKLIEELKLPRDLGRNPLFQVLVNLQNTSEELPAIPGLRLTPVRVDTRTAKFDLSIGMIERHDGLRVRITYNTHLFDHTTIERMLGHLEVLLSSILSDADRRISELLLIPKNEGQLLSDWNSTEREFYHGCFHQWFERQAATTPNRIAARNEQQVLSYAELNARANQLANYLSKRGVAPGVLTGIFVERSLEMLIGLLGILKAGGAYVPLDPAYPKERIAFILDDANAPVLLTQKSLLSWLPQSAATVICLDTDWKAIARESNQNLRPTATSRDLAYVIYTSGSTGKPKGVQVEHRNLVNFLTSMQTEPGIHAEDILLTVTTLSFDIAGLELFLPLVTGAQVFIASRDEASDANKLMARLRASKASLMQATPATWRLLIESGWHGDPHLMVLCGGEALPRELAEQLLPRCRELWNLYGPTETTIWSSVYRVTGTDWSLAPIGRPIANTQMYVLDKQRQLAPVGVAGELYIGGDGVARGYLNRPDLTAEKFIADPFSAKSGQRLYRTGDLARYRADGNLIYLGRMDNQIKLRGFRIELGEIEAVLSEHPAVQQSVVIVREDQPGNQQLVGYIVSDRKSMSVAGEKRSAEQNLVVELKRSLRQKLPDYMVPSLFMMLDAFPLTPNGKVDRRALPAPTFERSEKAIAPRNETEQKLLEIWQALLGIQEIGIQDNFFELGGHSLSAVRMINEIGKATGKQMPLATLFQSATIETLATALREDVLPEEQIVVQIQHGGAKPPLFLIVIPGMSALGYAAMARHVGEDQPVYKIQYPGTRLRGRPYTTAEYDQLAAEYLRAMKAIQPEGPYYLGGMCEGARVAFDMARALEASHEEVGLLAIFDTWVIENSQIRFLWMIDYYVSRLANFWRLPFFEKREAVAKLLRNRKDKGKAKATSRTSASEPFIRWPEAYWPGKDFAPPKFGGKITLFKMPKQPYYYKRDPLMGWEARTTAGVDLHVINLGSRRHMLIFREPHVRQLASKLAACLERAQEKSSRPISIPVAVGRGAAVMASAEGTES